MTLDELIKLFRAEDGTYTSQAPEGLAAAITDLEDPAAVRDEVVSLTEAIDLDSLDSEQATLLSVYASIAEAAHAEASDRVAAAVEQRRQAEEMKARIAATANTGGDGDEEGTEPEEAEEGEEETTEPAVEPETPKAPEPVPAASRRRVPLGNLPQGNVPTPKERGKFSTNLVVGVNAEARKPGSAYGSMRELAEAVQDNLRPTRAPRGVSGSAYRNELAQYHKPYAAEDAVYLGGRQSDEEIREIFRRVSDEKNLEGGSLIRAARAAQERYDEGLALTAAGGWCAPSETIYDLAPSETSQDGLWDLPEVAAPRGGVRWADRILFTDLYGNSNLGWDITEAEAIAGGSAAEKPCLEVDCPDFNEIRLDAIGLCVTSPILTQAGYPERVEQFINEVLAVHPHKVNNRLLTQAVATATAASTVVNWSTPPSNFAYDTSALTRILEAATWGAAFNRNKYRFSMNTTQEVVLPHWVLELSQTDFSRRPGDEDNMLVNRQRLERYFAERKLRVQWVYDWQDLGTNITTFNAPATVQMLIYPAGTFTKLTKNVLSFGTMYDSALLAENMGQQLWTEEGIALMRRDYNPLAITVSVCASGTTGAHVGDCEAPS